MMNLQMNVLLQIVRICKIRGDVKYVLHLKE